MNLVTVINASEAGKEKPKSIFESQLEGDREKLPERAQQKMAGENRPQILMNPKLVVYQLRSFPIIGEGENEITKHQDKEGEATKIKQGTYHR